MQNWQLEQALVDEFYFNTVVKGLPAAFQPLAVDAQILHHEKTSYPIRSLAEILGTPYWVTAWILGDALPVSADQCLAIAHGGALTFVGTMLLDNLVDRQTPDEPLIAALSQYMLTEARICFGQLFASGHPFWPMFDAEVRIFLNALAVEYRSVVQQREPYSYELVTTVDRGKAISCNIVAYAMGSLCGKPETAEAIVETYRLLTIGDQMGDDAQDWADDYRHQRATWPFHRLAEAEAVPVDTIMALDHEVIEDRLMRHRILLTMCNNAVSHLERAKDVVAAAGLAGLEVDALLDLRLEQENLRRRNVMAIAFFQGVAKKLASSANP